MAPQAKIAPHCGENVCMLESAGNHRVNIVPRPRALFLLDGK